MKKQYNQPNMEIEKFIDEDIVTTSGNVNEDVAYNIYFLPNTTD